MSSQSFRFRVGTWHATRCSGWTRRAYVCKKAFHSLRRTGIGEARASPQGSCLTFNGFQNSLRASRRQCLQEIRQLYKELYLVSICKCINLVSWVLFCLILRYMAKNFKTYSSVSHSKCVYAALINLKELSEIPLTLP